MTKVNIFTQSSGILSIDTPTPLILALLTGNGLGLSDAQKSIQIAQFAVPTGPYPLDIATEWVNAIASGGLSEDAAIDLLRRKYIARHGAPVDGEASGIVRRGANQPRTIEDTDLPADRYFRNAWEWSD